MSDERERQRLQSLERLGLTSAPDATLDRLARVVQRQLGVPVALVSLVDENRQYFPGLAGLGGWAGEARETPLSQSFCQHVVARHGPLVVTDARVDPLVAANRAIEDLGVIAYLGMPLTDSGNRIMGSLCAIDTQPREWSVAEVAALTDLAKLCSTELQARETLVSDSAASAELEWKAATRERQLRALVDSLPAMIGYWDRDLRNVIANHAYLEWFGLEPARIVGRHVKDVLGEELFQSNLPRMQAALTGSRQDFSRTIIDATGRVRHTKASYLPDRDADGVVVGFFVHVADVTALTEAVSFHDAVLAASPDLIYVMDLELDRVVWASRSFTQLLGYQPQEITALGDHLYDVLIHPDDREILEEANSSARALSDGETLQLRCRARHADGSYRWVQRRITPFERDDSGRVRQVLGVTRDIHQSVELAERLEVAAVKDDLTGLPNRRLLSDRLSLALKRQARTGLPVAVLYCDLDGFKRVNDTGGHQAGDAVLFATGQRISGQLRTEDTVARVGGDEFVVVLEPARRSGQSNSAGETPEDAALSVAKRIGAAVGEAVHIDGKDHYVTVSIGIALAGHGEDPDEVIRNADAAMYKAKGHGKARAELYELSLRADAADRARIEAALRRSLNPSAEVGVSPDPPQPRPQLPRPQLSVAYQPIYDTSTMEILGVEALARLDDEHGLPISPAEFIPVAEETGLIAQLGRVVLRTACQDLAAWRRDFPTGSNFGIAVNLSARQAGLADLVTDVTTLLRDNHLAPHLLTLELTESVLLEAGRSTMTALHALRHHGVLIAIDDFGTGYASLRYLTQLPVTSVKIDRSFTSGLPKDPVSATIVRAVTGLARDLGIGCVVEGIETAEQLHALTRGSHGQGFLLGRPGPEEGIRRLLANSAEQVAAGPGQTPLR
jgi:diguanylate cyclase (GGDEF)-like protein/PAS domain S-box-containing protein